MAIILYNKLKQGISSIIWSSLFLHLADAFIQSDFVDNIQAIHFLSVCVFPGNWTHNLLRC